MARVNVEEKAFSDLRIDVLGQLQGYSRFEALGRLAHLWHHNTEFECVVVPDALVNVLLGPGGAANIVAAGLGEVHASGGIYIKGARDYTGWLGEQRAKSSEGGKKRAASASRENGRFTSGSPAGAGDGLADITSGSPAGSSALTPTPSPSPSPIQEERERDAAAPLPLASAMPPRKQSGSPEALALAAAAVAELNRLAARNYAPTGEAVLADAKRLAAKGYTPEQAIAVVQAKYRQWAGDAKMAEQLKPSVLLRPSNFAKYLAEDVPTAKPIRAVPYKHFDDDDDDEPEAAPASPGPAPLPYDGYEAAS